MANRPQGHTWREGGVFVWGCKEVELKMLKYIKEEFVCAVCSTCGDQFNNATFRVWEYMQVVKRYIEWKLKRGWSRPWQ